MKRFMASMAALAAMISMPHSLDLPTPRRKRIKYNPASIEATPADLLGKSHGKGQSKRSKRRAVHHD